MTTQPSPQQAGHALVPTTIVPCTCFPQQQQATPAASSASSTTPSTLWLPLHQAQETWASFGKASSTTRALIATGHAFLALSWEQSALRQYQQAMQQQRMGYERAMDCSLEECLRNLDAALHHWQPSYHQLERLIHQRAIYEQITQEREVFTRDAQEPSQRRASEVLP